MCPCAAVHAKPHIWRTVSTIKKHSRLPPSNSGRASISASSPPAPSSTRGGLFNSSIITSDSLLLWQKHERERPWNIAASSILNQRKKSEEAAASRLLAPTNLGHRHFKHIFVRRYHSVFVADALATSRRRAGALRPRQSSSKHQQLADCINTNCPPKICVSRGCSLPQPILPSTTPAMHTVDGRGTITSLPSLIIRPPTSTTGKYIGQVNLTAPAALGSKADLGIALPTNPLVGIALEGVWEGVGPGLGHLEWILCIGRGDSRPPARPKLIEPLP